MFYTPATVVKLSFYVFCSFMISRGVEWCFFDQAGMGVKSFFLAFNLSMDMS